MSEEEDDTNKSVEVMGYKCAGMSDDNARQDVRRITFQELFASHNDIQIPIFQRAYCWTDEQLRKWWEDVDRTSADDGGHGVGNVMFKKVSRKGAVTDGRADGKKAAADAPASTKLVCVDGQQRMTTSMLLITAIRDRALQLQQQGQQDQQQDYQSVVNDINGVLFSDVAAMQSWAEDVARKIARNGEGHTEKNGTNSGSGHQGGISSHSQFQKGSFRNSVFGTQPSVLIEGALEKRSTGKLWGETWRKRHFVVKGHYLTYYLDEQAAKEDVVKGTINLEACSSIVARGKFMDITLEDGAVQSLRAKDKAQADEWADVITAIMTSPTAADENCSWTWSEYCEEGEVLVFSRLRPSFVDRSAFFHELLHGMIAHYHYIQTGGMGVNGSTTSTVASSPPVTRQKSAKDYFDRCLAEDLESNSSPSALRALLQQALVGVNLMYVEILNEVNLPQVFQWLQEKTLLGMGALLHNPSRGVNFGAGDMLRNTLLAALSGAASEAEEEETYKRLWLRPLEIRVRSGLVTTPKAQQRSKSVEELRRRAMKASGASLIPSVQEAATRCHHGWEDATMDDVMRSFVDAWDMAKEGSDGQKGFSHYRPPGFPGIAHRDGDGSSDNAPDEKAQAEQETWLQFGFIPGRFVGKVERQLLEMFASMQTHMPDFVGMAQHKFPPLLLFGRLSSCFEALQMRESVRRADDSADVRTIAAEAMLVALAGHAAADFQNEAERHAAAPSAGIQGF